MFHRETDAAKVARNRDAIFDLHAAALAWLEDYTGIPYPFGKFDFVLVPSFQFGGMEHAGAIFYNASGLLLDESATQNQLLGRASVIAHETAHMWFGDLVTMRWFNDVWMKEVFANFMAAKIVNPSFPQMNHELRFLLVELSGGVRGGPHGGVERRSGSALDNLNEAGSCTARSSTRRRRSSCGSWRRSLGEDGVPRRPARVPERARVRQRDVAGPDRVLDGARRRIWPRGATRGSRKPGGPTFTTELRVAERAHRAARVRPAGSAPRRGLVWTQQRRGRAGLRRDIRRIPLHLDAARVEAAKRAGCRRRSTCCRPAAASATAVRARRRHARLPAAHLRRNSRRR